MELEEAARIVARTRKKFKDIARVPFRLGHSSHVRPHL